MASSNLGNGATVTLSSTGSSLAVSKITIGAWSRARIERKLLDAAGPSQYAGGSVYDHAPIEIEFYFDSSKESVLSTNSGQHQFPGAETVTITWPIGTGESGAATLVGTGFITEVEWPEFDHDTYQMGKLTVSWDGETGPVFTKATASGA